MQRLVQEEAVRFLWNQVNSFSPLSFLLTYEFEKHTVDPEEVVNVVHFFSRDDLGGLWESNCHVICYTAVLGGNNIQKY